MSGMMYATIEGPIDPEDAGLPPPESESKPVALRRISDRHRRLAALIAEGMPDGDAGIATGYTPARVSILKKDPSFIQLISFYRGKIDEQFSTIQEKLATVTGLAADELAQRLEDSAEEWKNDELMKLVSLGADRLGFGPKAAGQTENVHVNIAVRLEQAQKRLTAVREDRVIEGCVLEGTEDE